MKAFLTRLLSGAVYIACLLLMFGTLNAQTFTYTGSLNPARFGHTATLLNDGTDLIVGGATSLTGGWMAAAQIYSPTSGAFSNTTGGLHTARNLHTATLLSNGMVLIAGGYNGSALSSAELYNPASGTFATTNGSMTVARFSHTATLLQNGMVLIAGGANYSGPFGSAVYLASAELYDPATGTFTATGSMTYARELQTATLLNNGQVLIAGGIKGTTPLATAELYTYNPTSGGFSVTGSMPTVKYLHTATLLPNGQVLIAGGCTSPTGGWLSAAELYDPTSGLFISSGSLNTARIEHTATLLANGLVLVAGGYNYPNGYLSSGELYDPTTGTFIVTGGLNTARVEFTATLLNNGSVLAAGGYTTGAVVIATAELYQMPYAEIIPPYQILSVLYAPPGNASSNGFLNTTSYGTTTSVGQNFTQGTQITYTFTGPLGLSSTSVSFGNTVGVGSTQSYQLTYGQGSGSAIFSNRNPVDHTQDQFYLWLNPMITAIQTGTDSMIYNTGTNPNSCTPAVSPCPPSVVNIIVADLENPSQIPLGVLNPQLVDVNGEEVSVPGLSSICANPVPQCTQSPCGCVASDFTGILVADTLVSNPNTSPDQVTDPESPGGQRYVLVNSQTLEGPQCQGCEPVKNMFVETDTALTSTTETATNGHSEGYSVSGGIKIFGFGLQITGTTTFTWTNTLSYGESNSTAHQESVTLGSSSVDCDESVNIYEDTVYHTFAFYIPFPSSYCP